MSLFAGTGFVASKKDGSTTTPTEPHTVPGKASTSSAPVVERDTSTPATASSSAVGTSSKPGWSAALKFAPSASRRAKQTAKPHATYVPSNFKQVSSDQGGANVIGEDAASATVFSAAPVLNSARASGSMDTATDVGPNASATDVGHNALAAEDGKRIFKAPAMTMEGDVGTMTAGRKREAPGDAEAHGPKRRWKKKSKKHQFEMPVHTFQPHEAYDPSQPNDLEAYKDYRKSKREEARMRRKEEQARRDRAGRGQDMDSDEESYYSEDEQQGLGRRNHDDEPSVRKDAPRSFAPPSFLYSGGAPAPSPTVEAPPPPPSVPAPINKAESAEDAYARRLAMSQQQAPPPPAFVASQRNESADDAYARRVAMSQGRGPTPATAPRIDDEEPAPRGLGSAVSVTQMTNVPSFVTGQAQHAIPNLVSSRATTSTTPPIDQAPPQASPQDVTAEIEKRKQAAQAIAAKFAMFSAPTQATGEPSISSGEAQQLSEMAESKVLDTTGLSGEDVVAMLAKQVEEESQGGPSKSGSFAERMMQRWGHQQGQGLGKHGDGIVHALKAENIDTQKKASKSGWVQASSSKGKLVNLNPDRKKEADLLKYGEPSQIVCLTNVLAHPDLADEELQVEIGQECEKNGTVERVVMHVIDQADLVQVGQDGPPPDPSDAFRIFIVFKSIPGAWKTVTEMDGRFFGGRQIRATYFSLDRFNRGDRSGPLL